MTTGDCRPPDWRFKEACSFVAASAKAARTLPADPVVQHLARLMKNVLVVARRTNAGAVKNYCRVAWPSSTKVLYLGTVAKDSCATGMLELCLIKGWDHAKASEAGMPFSVAVYKLYEQAFFDLSGIREFDALMQDTLLDRHTVCPGKLRQRFLALQDKDGATGMKAQGIGQLTAVEVSLLRDASGSERQRQLFDYIHSCQKLPAELRAGFMESALKAESDRDFQLKMRDKESEGSESLEELAQHLEEGIRAYSQTELNQCSHKGVDSANGYTQININNQ